MTLSSKSKVQIIVAAVALLAVAIVVVQNLAAVQIRVFYFSVETSLAVLLPTVFVLGAIVGWAVSAVLRRRANRRNKS